MTDLEISTEKKSLTLTDVPIDIVEKIYKYLDSIDIVRLRGVSKSIQEFLDSLDETESLNEFRINHLLSLEIIDNNLAIKTKYIPKYECPQGKNQCGDKLFPITGFRQLNWYRPRIITFDDSKIFESSMDLRYFLEEVQIKYLINVVNTENPNLREKRLKNVCAKFEVMEKLRLFYCQDENLTEHELEKIMFSLKCNVPVFEIEINEKLPIFKKSVLSAIDEITPNASIRIKPHNSWYFGELDEGDLEGLEWFLKNQKKNRLKKTIDLGKCSESTVRQLRELSRRIDVSNAWFSSIDYGCNSIHFQSDRYR